LVACLIACRCFLSMYQRRVTTSRDHQLFRAEITSCSRGHDESGFLLQRDCTIDLKRGYWGGEAAGLGASPVHHSNSPPHSHLHLHMRPAALEDALYPP
jgi:hypothetical protein